MDPVCRYESLRLIRQLAFQYLGLPYRYGGDDPIAGFDCSGFVVELLTAVGVLKHKSDYTSQGLYDEFKHRPTEPAYCGALVFYGDGPTEIEHVALCIGPYHCIEAAGGDSTTDTVEEAERRNAVIRVRPIHGIRRIVDIVDPFAGP